MIEQQYVCLYLCNILEFTWVCEAENNWFVPSMCKERVVGLGRPVVVVSQKKLIAGMGLFKFQSTVDIHFPIREESLSGDSIHLVLCINLEVQQ